MINFGLIFSYFLVFVAVVGTTVLPLALAFMEGDLAGLKKMGITLAIMIVLFALCYGLAGDEVTEAYTKVDNSIVVDATVSRMVGGGLLLMYLSTLIAVGGIIYTEVSNLFK